MAGASHLIVETCQFSLKRRGSKGARASASYANAFRSSRNLGARLANHAGSLRRRSNLGSSISRVPQEEPRSASPLAVSGNLQTNFNGQSFERDPGTRGSNHPRPLYRLAPALLSVLKTLIQRTHEGRAMQ